jgi:phosphoenolpyruvate carboxylase
VAARLKLTEQGEVIATRYANEPLALRALEQTTSATLLASTAGHERAVERAGREGADAMDELASTAAAAYRALVWDDPAFEAVFAAATPIEQIAGLHLGSRPAARGVAGRPGSAVPSLASLRAIPWVFAWTQARLSVPAWYGIGTALDRFEQRHGPAGMARLQGLYARWPFFRVLLQNAEVALARTDPQIGARYLGLAGPAGARVAATLADEHARSVRTVLAVMGRSALLDGVPALQRSIELRTPYLDPLSELQVQALARLRAVGPDDPGRPDLERLIALTISGIAAGVQGTG